MQRIATTTAISFFITPVLVFKKLHYISHRNHKTNKSNTGNKYTCTVQASRNHRYNASTHNFRSIRQYEYLDVNFKKRRVLLENFNFKQRHVIECAGKCFSRWHR